MKQYAHANLRSPTAYTPLGYWISRVYGILANLLFSISREISARYGKIKRLQRNRPHDIRLHDMRFFCAQPQPYLSHTQHTPIQSTRFSTMLSTAKAICPPCKSASVSAEKVENVLRPPQKPVTSSSLWACPTCPFSKRPKTKAMAMAASTLESKVATGNRMASGASSSPIQ